MSSRFRTMAAFLLCGTLLILGGSTGRTDGQPPTPPEKGEPPRPDEGKGRAGPGGFFPGGGPPMGGPMAQQRKLIPQFDKDGDGRLNREERQAAREWLKTNRPMRGPGGFGGFRGKGGPPGGNENEGRPKFDDRPRGKDDRPDEKGRPPRDREGQKDRPPQGKDGGPENRDQFRGKGGGFGPPGGGGPFGRGEPAKPGPRVSPADVKNYPDAKLFEPTILRTVFIDFPDADWEAELADFYHTDVEIPATLTVDGKKYPDVGVHFRGASSYFTVPAGSKRSMNLSMDFVDDKQRLYGAKALNLLNCNGDPSFLSTVLYSHISGHYLPTPKANLVKVVINGESWGIYTSAQQYDRVFIAEHFKSTKGTRWKVHGSPGGGGGLDYVGSDIENYKRRYEIKSKDSDKAWKALIKLCKTLHETPVDQLEDALKPMLNVDGLLWFLAMDIAVINSDGYWIRASDYCIYLDEKGKFHIIPHDMNECFRPGMGPGMGGPGGPGRGGFGGPFGKAGGPDGPPPKGKEGDVFVKADERPPAGNRNPFALDPLTGMDDPRKPLRSKILKVPAFREKYLDNVRTIARDWLDWNKLGPVVAGYRELIDKEIEADTKKLSNYAAFQRATADAVAAPAEGERRPTTSLRMFADQRRKFLMEYQEKKATE